MRRPRPLRPTAVAAGAVACAALSAAGACGLPAGTAATAATAKSAQAEYEAAIKAATNQSVHFQTDINQAHITLEQSGDAGKGEGSESLTVHNGKLTEHIDAEVVGRTGYLRGNRTGLQNILALTAAQSRKYAGRWLSFPLSNSTYAQFVGGLLRSQVATELGFSGPFTFARHATVNGQHAVGIKGSVSTANGGSVPEILYVPSTGKPLPIEEVTDPGAKAHSSSVHGTVNFSNWGERVTVSAPAHPVALSKLAPKSASGATSTSGG